MPVITKQAILFVSFGEYLMKCNKDTNGRIKKFFKVGNDQLQWASKQNYFENNKNVSNYSLDSIRDVIYGKCSTTLCKKYNKSLEPWRCFSIILENRTLDFYVSNQTIKLWVLGMSYLIQNNSKYYMTVGGFWWRRLKLLL